jgi:pilus assembly protein CpaD
MSLAACAPATDKAPAAAPTPPPQASVREINLHQHQCGDGCARRSCIGAEKLGLRERDAVKGFAMAYQQEGHGAVIISRPSNGPDDISAMRAAADARAMMLAEGVDQSMIAEGTYDGTGARSAPLIISYRAYEAVVPNCPDISHWDFTDTSSNAALPSLGCAVAVNLAAMIANPSDLVGDQPTDPADIARRGIMFSKYRQGVRTSSERNNDASGAISTVVE